MRNRPLLRIAISATVLSCLAVTSAEGQSPPPFFAGAIAGISTLSADARSEVTPGGAAVSLYKPENGPALNLLVGVHLHEYVAVQANYIGNRNDLVLTSVRATAVGSSVYEQPRSSAQHALVADLLVYFRERRSRVRPYLSAGVGVVRLETRAGAESRASNVMPPPAASAATHAVLRVAVGMDVAVGRGWSARYSFSEGISGNPIGVQLSPPGQRGLANFQNLFGVVHAF